MFIMFFYLQIDIFNCMIDCTVADVWSLNKMTIIIAQSGCFCHLLLLANRGNPVTVSRSDSKSQMTK